jgi:hypothetical protein
MLNEKLTGGYESTVYSKLLLSGTISLSTTTHAPILCVLGSDRSTVSLRVTVISSSISNSCCSTNPSEWVIPSCKKPRFRIVPSGKEYVPLFLRAMVTGSSSLSSHPDTGATTPAIIIS